VEIASALADIGAPVWLPELKLWARSVGARGVGVWGAPGRLAALGAVASMLGVALGVESCEALGSPALPTALLGFTGDAMVDDPVDGSATWLARVGVEAAAVDSARPACVVVTAFWPGRVGATALVAVSGRLDWVVVMAFWLGSVDADALAVDPGTPAWGAVLAL
jgi:hypothetical protein